MSTDAFCCPVCKGPLAAAPLRFSCAPCGREFPVVDGIPDFFVSESERDAIDDPNKTWLDPHIVEARETVYCLSIGELRGMAYCMQEIARRTRAGCRILEVGMGTGHFSRWLAEVSAPGAAIYAFDFSWPIIAKARARTQGLPGVILFRANARGHLPFPDGHFDLLFLRLSPLGAHGVPNVQAAHLLLKPGGWLFEAGREPGRYETPPTEWAIQHGYESAEHHVWQYPRLQTAPEFAAERAQRDRLTALGWRRSPESPEPEIRADGSVWATCHENLLIAHKPASPPGAARGEGKRVG